MTEVVHQANNGAIRLRIEARGIALALFKPRYRNSIIKRAMTTAGETLVNNFWYKRFSKYIQRQPFNYPKTTPYLAVNKIRHRDFNDKSLWLDIKGRLFDGWDPWKDSIVQLRQSVLRKFAREQGTYEQKKARSRDPLIGLTREVRAQLYADFRRWAKKQCRDEAQRLYDAEKIRPLVLSGKLRKAAWTARVRSIVNRTKAQTIITTPRAGRQNPWVIRAFGILSRWEFDAFIRYLDDALTKEIAGAAASGEGRRTSIIKRNPRAIQGLVAQGEG